MRTTTTGTPISIPLLSRHEGLESACPCPELTFPGALRRKLGGRVTAAWPSRASQSRAHRVNRRGNEYDVSCQVNTTDSALVNSEVNRIFLELYPRTATAQIDLAFRDLTRMYRGDRPGYHACDTAYHDVQHVLEVTLAMARLIDGYERARIGLEPLDAAMFQLGVVTALFHDCGYIRTLDDRQHKNGGELTLTHVSRGSRFLKEYLPRIGMGGVAEVAASLIHFTRYEIPVAESKVPSLTSKLLGSLLGSADIIAQMSDRSYPG